MSKSKGAGTSKNNHDSAGRRLGVKIYGGQSVTPGDILVRQRGAAKISGPGTFMSKDQTIHAAKEGVVKYDKIKIVRFSGHHVPRTRVSVV